LSISTGATIVIWAIASLLDGHLLLYEDTLSDTIAKYIYDHFGSNLGMTANTSQRFVIVLFVHKSSQKYFALI